MLTGVGSPRHLAVPIRLPAPLLPRPTLLKPHRSPCDTRHDSPPAHMPCMCDQTLRCKGQTLGATASGQGTGQSRGLLGPAGRRCRAGEAVKGARQGKGQGPGAKVARKGSSGSRALVVTRQQEEAWQTRFVLTCCVCCVLY